MRFVASILLLAAVVHAEPRRERLVLIPATHLRDPQATAGTCGERGRTEARTSKIDVAALSVEVVENCRERERAAVLYIRTPTEIFGEAAVPQGASRIERSSLTLGSLRHGPLVAVLQLDLREQEARTMMTQIALCTVEESPACWHFGAYCGEACDRATLVDGVLKVGEQTFDIILE